MMSTPYLTCRHLSTVIMVFSLWSQLLVPLGAMQGGNNVRVCVCARAPACVCDIHLHILHFEIITDLGRFFSLIRSSICICDSSLYSLHMKHNLRPLLPNSYISSSGALCFLFEVLMTKSRDCTRFFIYCGPGSYKI